VPTASRKTRKYLILRVFFYFAKLRSRLLFHKLLQPFHIAVNFSSLFSAGRLLGVASLGFAILIGSTAAQAQGRSNAATSKVQKTKQAERDGPESRAVRKTAKAVPARSVVRVSTPSRPSYGQLAGLHATPDDLELRSSVALVVDQDTHEVLLSKNDLAVLPIASITKLMTGLVITEARLPLDETIVITDDDVDTEKGSRSRLKVGTTLTRGEALHLALMSSENRAAHALGRTHPAGLAAFVEQMNLRAQTLGMQGTRFVEPTGLSSKNQSSARDLALLVHAASQDPTLRSLSTSPGHEVAVGNRTLQFNTTNRLVLNPAWDIGLQKTGYISEAGQCLVMQAKVAGRKLIMVFLDSAGKLSRIGDAERVRRWVETLPGSAPVLPQRVAVVLPSAGN
jgi:serine-type D-Ala-D-Ala endopeptidase (penicillin-binding protein 7)